MEIIVDGYNIIARDHVLSGNLQHRREWLVQRLSRYQAIRGHHISLVFDGWKAGWPDEVAENRGGIRVVYSRQGEKADTVIVRLAREKGSGCVVITSDREVQRAIEKNGAVAIDSDVFDTILRRLERTGSTDRDEPLPRSTGKGNPRRLSREERKRQEKLKKL